MIGWAALKNGRVLLIPLLGDQALSQEDLEDLESLEDPETAALAAYREAEPSPMK